MPACVRIGDGDTDGDACISGSPNVFTNNIPQVRISDSDTDGDTKITGSPNVFANNLAVHRIGDIDTDGDSMVSGSPNVFANSGGGGGSMVTISSPSLLAVPADPPVSIQPSAQAAINANVKSYVTAQTISGGPNIYYNPSAAADGVKGNYQDTPEVATISTGTVSATTSSSDLIPFLTKCLEEATKGVWRETGQGGAPSNPNITGIWKNLGYPATGAWTSDQTAWCAGFMNFALKSSGYKYVQSASAKAITQDPGKWNAVQVSKSEAQPGDIAFWSYSHVNFVFKVQNGKYSFVGGNQSPKGGSNNPNDGDLTESYPNGTPATNPNWVSCWRPSKG